MGERTSNGISVIIPTLNEEKLITRVLQQFDDNLKNRFDIELIVSDGGSSDKTLDIAQRYVNKIVRHTGERKQNIAEGRNKGAEISKGDVLVFFNADTELDDPKLFFEKISIFGNNNTYSGLTCNIEVFKNEEKLSDKLFHSFYNKYVKFLNKIGLGMGRGECQVIKREYFYKAGKYNEDMFAGEDFDLFKRLRKLGKIKVEENLIVRESPRRYRKFGYIKVIYQWLKNSIWIMIFKKSSSNEWEPVR